MIDKKRRNHKKYDLNKLCLIIEKLVMILKTINFYLKKRHLNLQKIRQDQKAHLYQKSQNLLFTHSTSLFRFKIKDLTFLPLFKNPLKTLFLQIYNRKLL